MVTVEATIRCSDREAAAELLEQLAYEVRHGEHDAGCDVQTQQRYGGSVFVTEDADSAEAHG